MPIIIISTAAFLATPFPKIVYDRILEQINILKLLQRRIILSLMATKQAKANMKRKTSKP